MKVKKIFKTIIIFISAMILICILLSLLISISSGSTQDILNRTLNYLLYIIGYGSLMHDNLLLQDLFGVLGIVTLSIMSAYLTVNLFWRVDDVFISNNIAVWKSSDSSKYNASVLIGNKGKNICKLEVSFVAYDENKNPIGEMGKTYTYPLLIKGGLWKIDMPIENGFLFDMLRIIRQGRKNCLIYAIFEYVDSETGQGSIKVQEYSSKEVFVSQNMSGFDEDSECDKKLKWKQFNLLDKDMFEDNNFSNWICRNIISFDLGKAKPINNNHISLLIESDNVTKELILNAEVDFGTTNNPPEFAMALLDFNKPFQDWTSYYLKGSYFQFEISGDDGINEIQLEIKNSSGQKLIDRKINVTNMLTKHSFKLNNIDINPECFSEVKEICFTVFNKPKETVKGNFKIHSCEILLEEENINAGTDL